MCGCRYTDTRKHITTSIDIQYISHTHRSPAHGGYQGAVLRDGMVEGTTLLPQRACLQARDLDLWPDGSSMNDELRGWRGVVCYTECSVCNDLLRSQYVHMWWNCMERLHIRKWIWSYQVKAVFAGQILVIDFVYLCVVTCHVWVLAMVVLRI